MISPILSELNIFCWTKIPTNLKRLLINENHYVRNLSDVVVEMLVDRYMINSGGDLIFIASQRNIRIQGSWFSAQIIQTLRAPDKCSSRKKKTWIRNFLLSNVESEFATKTGVRSNFNVILLSTHNEGLRERAIFTGFRKENSCVATFQIYAAITLFFCIKKKKIFENHTNRKGKLLTTFTWPRTHAEMCWSGRFKVYDYFYYYLM